MEKCGKITLGSKSKKRKKEIKRKSSGFQFGSSGWIGTWFGSWRHIGGRSDAGGKSSKKKKNSWKIVEIRFNTNCKENTRDKSFTAVKCYSFCQIFVRNYDGASSESWLQFYATPCNSAPDDGAGEGMHSCVLCRLYISSAICLLVQFIILLIYTANHLFVCCFVDSIVDSFSLPAFPLSCEVDNFH